MAVRYHPHARQRMAERGAGEQEIAAAVGQGEQLKQNSAEPGFVETFCLKSNGEANTIK